MRRTSVVSHVVTRPRSARRSMRSYGAMTVPIRSIRGRGRKTPATVSGTSPTARRRLRPRQLRTVGRRAAHQAALHELLDHHPWALALDDHGVEVFGEEIENACEVLREERDQRARERVAQD